jgi:UDP-3-O-[3-hydroxymyristoyl] glucosamine N-acyltransferase
MTFVTKSIGKPGVYSSGLPIMAHADWLRNTGKIRRLEEIERLARGKGASGGDDATDVD